MGEREGKKIATPWIKCSTSRLRQTPWQTGLLTGRVRFDRAEAAMGKRSTTWSMQVFGGGGGAEGKASWDYCRGNWQGKGRRTLQGRFKASFAFASQAALWAQGSSTSRVRREASTFHHYVLPLTQKGRHQSVCIWPGTCHCFSLFLRQSFMDFLFKSHIISNQSLVPNYE